MSAAVVAVAAAAAAAVAGTLGRGRRPDTAQVAHGHIFAGRRREKTWRQLTVDGSSCDEGSGMVVRINVSAAWAWRFGRLPRIGRRGLVGVSGSH